jgi:ankyrin repeat protein
VACWRGRGGRESGPCPAGSAAAQPRGARDMNIARLLTAAQSDDPLRLQRLLDEEPDLNQADCDAWTALHMAAVMGSGTLVRALASRGAETAPSNRDGETPLHLAVLLDRPDAARALLEFGGVALLDVCNSGGWAPLDYAEIDPQSRVAAVLDHLAPRHVSASRHEAGPAPPSRVSEPSPLVGVGARDEAKTDGDETYGNHDGCPNHRGPDLDPAAPLPSRRPEGRPVGLPGLRTRRLPSTPALPAVPPLPAL